jgi:hypothetical protein
MTRNIICHNLPYSIIIYQNTLLVPVDSAVVYFQVRLGGEG